MMEEIAEYDFYLLFAAEIDRISHALSRAALDV
jgi:hypothetical protein